MHHVLMLCAAGVSTHLLAEKVQDLIDGEGYPARVAAWSIAQVKENGTNAELLLLTPQVEFEADLVRALFPDRKVELIDFDAFMRMDAAAVVGQIKRAFSE